MNDASLPSVGQASSGFEPALVADQVVLALSQLPLAACKPAAVEVSQYQVAGSTVTTTPALAVLVAASVTV